MSNPTAIITGASTGIGKSLALLLAQHHYDLGLIARRENLLTDLQKQITQQFPQTKVIIHALDVSDTAQIAPVVEKMAAQLGRLDLFVANAGVGANTPAWESQWKVIKRILDVNVIGAIGSLEAAKTIMLTQGFGHLVGVSSVAGYRGLPTASAYCTSKAALSTYLESIRPDLKPNNIAVTDIRPGYIATPMTEQNEHMPFLLDVETATHKIYNAIQKQKARFTFPWQMKILTTIMKHTPDRVFDFLVGLKKRKGMFGASKAH